MSLRIVAKQAWYLYFFFFSASFSQLMGIDEFVFHSLDLESYISNDNSLHCLALKPPPTTNNTPLKHTMFAE